MVIIDDISGHVGQRVSCVCVCVCILAILNEMSFELGI